MKVGELRSLIQKLQNIQDAMGAKTPAKDLAKLDALFEGHEQQSVESFVAEAEVALAAKPAKKVPVKVSFDETIVGKYVELLRSANRAKGDFAEVFGQMSGDKCVGKAEAIAIAWRFLGTQRRFGTKKEAMEAIQARYVRDRQAESKRDMIEKMAL